MTQWKTLECSHLGSAWRALFSVSAAAKKPSDAAPKPKKPPAPKAKKPDKSIWDSDSDPGDTMSKKPAPALKGTFIL